LFGGSSYDDLVTDLDLVGYLEAVGKKRTLTFDPTDRNDGKNTCNLPSVMELPTVVDKDGKALKNSFLIDAVINPYIANLEERVKLAGEFEKVMNELKDAVSLITDELSANDLVSRIDSFTHVGNSKAMAGQLISKKAKELGLTFDAKSKQYGKV
jgi:hypothetical protein